MKYILLLTVLLASTTFAVSIWADEYKILDSLYEQMKNDENLANNLVFENTKKRNIVIREFCEKFIALPTSWKESFASDKRINPSSVKLESVSLIAGENVRCRLKIYSDAGACFEYLHFSAKSPYLFEGVNNVSCRDL